MQPLSISRRFSRVMFSWTVAERNSGQCEGESFGSHRRRCLELRPPTDSPMELIESMYIHPSVNCPYAIAGHKGGFTVGMRPALVASFVSSCTLVRRRLNFQCFTFLARRYAILKAGLLRDSRRNCWLAFLNTLEVRRQRQRHMREMVATP